jgi:hypothetical protein
VSVNVAARWRTLPRKNFGERGFTGAVTTNQTYFVASRYTKINARHKKSGANSYFEILDGKHY